MTNESNIQITPDIHKIIDNAMAKKDHSVMIYISESGISITISPYSDEPLRWIDKKSGFNRYECPTCGACERDTSSYCSSCGEKLALPKTEEEKEKEKKNETN